MGTYINANSDLKRKQWMREGLIQAKHKSFWAPYTGQGLNSPVRQVNNLNASEGHTVVFDYDGHLIGRAIKGKETAFGKGEQKRKFSDKLTVERYRLVADNGDAFDAVDIGDLSLSQHSDSREKLGDLFSRFKDQNIFDAVQGTLASKGVAEAPTHIIDVGTTFDYNALIDVEQILRTSRGFSTGGLRRPLEPFRTADGRDQWLMVIDSAIAGKLRKSSGFQTIMSQADVRGNENRLLRGVIGRIGQLLIVEAGNFFGSTRVATATWGMDDTSTDMPGLRQKDAAGLWTGQPGFDYTVGDIISRGAILGNNAIQMAFGKMPDYKFQESEDFGIKSESALEVWMDIQKAQLLAEKTGEYVNAPVAAMDWGIVAFDVKVIDR